MTTDNQQLLNQIFTDLENNIRWLRVTGLPYPESAVSWTEQETSAADTAASITKAGEAGKKHYVTGYLVILRGAVSDSDVSIQVKDGGNVVWQDYIGEAAAKGTRIDKVFFVPVEFTESADAVLEVGAAGASAVTELNLIGYTI